MDATNNIATDLFYKIRSRFSGLKLGAETGQITIMPEEARFFDFDYMEGEKPIGHVSISLAEPNSMKVYFSSGITESMDDGQKDNWYGFLRELRNFAKRRLLAFDTRDISKDYLDKKDYAFLSQNSKPKSANPNTMDNPVGESIMSESQMYGTKTMSYQKLMDTRLIIKHSKAVMDDMQPGARTRNISALFVENQDGERFKYPFIHLAGARAMQRHVANGGLPYDDIGKSIIGMSEEIAQLRSFSSYVVRNDLMNSDTNSIVERGQSRLEGLREQIAKLSKQGHYESYKENFQAPEQYDVPDEVVEDFVEKFTVKNFKEDIKSVFPVLYRLMQEESTVGYDDIVAMTYEEVTEDEEQEEAYDPFQKFEAWAMQLGEESPITSDDEETKAQAVKELQELVSQAFPAGIDGTNAIESLKGIIEDPQLYKGIKDTAKEDPNADLRGAIQQYLELYAPDVLEQLDFGDFDPNAQAGAEPEAAAETPAEQPQMASDDPDERNKKDDKDDLPFDADDDVSDKDEFGNTIKHRARHLARKGMRQAMDVKEVAEFINSFYDRNTGTFPKGPEGVCTMVGKKFGEQAEQVARKFVERMAPHQEQGAEQMQELARIRELSGIHSAQPVTQEAAGGHIWDEVGDDQDKAQLKSMAGRIVKMYQRSGEADASEDEILATLDEIVRKYMPEVGKMNNVAHISQEFFDKFPLKKSEPEFDDDGEEMPDEEGESIRDDFHRNIWNMVKIAHDAEKGDTSMYGYKVHPREEDSVSESQDGTFHVDTKKEPMIDVKVVDYHYDSYAEDIIIKLENAETGEPVELTDITSGRAEIENWVQKQMEKQRDDRDYSEDSGEELDRIRKLSGISQGLGL